MDAFEFISSLIDKDPKLEENFLVPTQDEILLPLIIHLMSFLWCSRKQQRRKNTNLQPESVKIHRATPKRRTSGPGEKYSHQNERWTLWISDTRKKLSDRLHCQCLHKNLWNNKNPSISHSELSYEIEKYTFCSKEKSSMKMWSDEENAFDNLQCEKGVLKREKILSSIDEEIFFLPWRFSKTKKKMKFDERNSRKILNTMSLSLSSESNQIYE